MSCNRGNALTPLAITRHLALPCLIPRDDEEIEDSVFLAPNFAVTNTPVAELTVALATGSATTSAVLQNGRVSPSSPNTVPINPSSNRATQTAVRKISGSSVPPRKLSTSGLLQDPSLSVYAAAVERARESFVADSTMRKISQVGHVFTSTFGWSRHPSHDVIVAQSRTLCGRYIRYKVRALTGISCKKLNLQRLRSVTNLSAIFGPTSPVAEMNPSLKTVSSHLRRLGTQLERSHPKLFRSVTSNVGIKALSNEATALNLLHSVACELFLQEINWGRVVALFAVSGALAMDFVRLGRPEYVMGIVDGLANIVDRQLANWIANQGGWEGLHSQFRKSRRKQAMAFILYYFLPVAVLATLAWSF